MKVKASDEAAKAAEIDGFVEAQNLDNLRKALKALKMAPYDGGCFLANCSAFIIRRALNNFLENKTPPPLSLQKKLTIDAVKDYTPPRLAATSPSVC